MFFAVDLVTFTEKILDGKLHFFVPCAKTIEIVMRHWVWNKNISAPTKGNKVFENGPSKFFKGCLPENLLSPLLNTLSQISLVLIKSTCDFKISALQNCQKLESNCWITITN